jgi:hypothetical protein
MMWKALSGGFLFVIVLASCRSSDLGTGMNTVDRNFSCSVKEAHDAAVATLTDEKLKIESDQGDALESKIVAKRGTSDDKVLVDVKGLDSNKTNVSVRVEPGDKDKAKLVLDKIGEKLTPAAK